jgi:hypothetical protein
MQKVAMPCPPHGLAGFSWFLAEAVLLTKRVYVLFGTARAQRQRNDKKN